MTSDEYPVYKTAIFEAYAVAQGQPRTGRPGRPRKPKKILPRKLMIITIILGLSIDHAEHGVGVGLAVDVGDPPIVADDGDALGALLPSRGIGILRSLEGDGRGHGGQ